MIRVFAACGLYERSVCLIWSLCCVVFSLCLASSALAQTPPSDCTRPNQSSGQQDGGSSGDASGCIRDAKKMTYGNPSFHKGYVQTIIRAYDHTDVYYYDYGASILDLNQYYCVEFRAPSGSPSPINSALTFTVWRSNYGSRTNLKYAGTVTTTKGFGLYISQKERLYFSLHLPRSNSGGQYAFKVTRGKNCGGQAPPVELDYHVSSAYKNDTYTGTKGITSTDGKGVALFRSFDRTPLGTGPNTTTQDGDRFSFVVRSTVEPKYNFYLQLFIRGGGSTVWRSYSFQKDATYRPSSSEKFQYRYYHYLTCTRRAGSNTMGPGSDYQYYFKLRHDNKTVYLPPQAANGQYLDAPDCALPPLPEPEPEPRPEPRPEPVPDAGGPELRPDAPLGMEQVGPDVPPKDGAPADRPGPADRPRGEFPGGERPLVDGGLPDRSPSEGRPGDQVGALDRPGQGGERQLDANPPDVAGGEQGASTDLSTSDGSANDGSANDGLASDRGQGTLREHDGLTDSPGGNDGRQGQDGTQADLSSSDGSSAEYVLPGDLPPGAADRLNGPPGCGCQGSGPGPLWAWLWFGVVLLWSTRRRIQHGDR